MSATVLKYEIHNGHENSRVVIIEPWAEEINIPQNETLEITVSCPAIGTLEIVLQEPYLVVWLWSGCRATLSIDGQDCTPPSLDIPSP